MEIYRQVIKNSRIIRTFDENISGEELVWHRDERDREVTIIGKTDWLFQFDNEIPIPLEGTIFIPKMVYHRAIKGTGPLTVSILEK